MHILRELRDMITDSPLTTVAIIVGALMVFYAVYFGLTGLQTSSALKVFMGKPLSQSTLGDICVIAWFALLANSALRR